MNATEQNRPRWVVGVLLAILLVPIAVHAQTWEPLKDKLLAAIPDYQDVSPPIYTAMAHLWTHPKTDDVYCFMSRGYGVLVSADGGDSWSKVDSEVFGRSWFGCWGTSVDPMTGNMALFVTALATKEAYGRAWESQGMITLNAGETWQPLHFRDRTPGKSRNGWSWGAVSWHDDPKVWVAKEHHLKMLWRTEDSGETWSQLAMQGTTFAVASRQTIVVAVHNEAGLHRSSDAGKTNTFVKVSDFTPTGGPAVQFGKTLYWAMKEGLARSTDDGLTWKLCGTLWAVGNGPFFGRNEKELVVVTESHYRISRDQGSTWQELAALPEGRSKPPRDSHAWDHVRGILYFGRVGQWPSRLKLEPLQQSTQAPEDMK